MLGSFAQLAFQGAKSDEERNKISLQLIEKAYKDKANSTVPEFHSELEWLNTKEALTFKSHLKGKVVVLDFFTYCCINCMHILPDLHALEDELSVEDGLVVIGVHSAKFENEKTSQNILNAVLRYDITHPVVNDYLNAMWEDLDITCWPTLMIVGPSGEQIVSLVGEGNKDAMFSVCRTAVEFYKSRNQLSQHSLPIKLYKDNLPPSSLSFPGKIAAAPSGNKLAISDSGHHRILITTCDGVVLSCIGGKEPGWKDGLFEEARFHSPQGICWSKEMDKLFVADTENHAIRVINLTEEKVSTIAGTGVMGTDKLGGATGQNQPLSSPWDVAIGPPHEDILFIAMAGTHTIWGYFLETATWQKGSEHKKDTCMNYAGTGKEENRNNSYPHRASFAQPSGLTFASEEPYSCMFVADSESSSIRSIKFKDGAVKGVVGGERDPMNLFAFGDEDGVGIDAKLQHPLGVAWNPEEKRLYVADSYNHKIKVVDPMSKSCATFAGSGTPGKADSKDLSLAWFNEPGGLSVAPGGKEIFIADTNNHAIRVLDLVKKSVKELPIVFSNTGSTTEVDSKSTVTSIASKRAVTIDVPAVEASQASTLAVTLNIRLPPGHKLTEDAPSCYQAYLSEQGMELKELTRVTSLDPSLSFPVSIATILASSPENPTIRVEAVIYYCSNAGVCLMKSLVYLIPLKVSSESKSTIELSLGYSLEA